MKRFLMLAALTGLATMACSGGPAGSGLDWGEACDEETCEHDAAAGAAGAAAGSSPGGEHGVEDDGAETLDEAPVKEQEHTPDDPVLDVEDEEPEPVEGLHCGSDGETMYEMSCADLSAECADAGASFVCHDQKPSKQCQSWGTCAFLKLWVFTPDDEPSPYENEILPPEEEPLADVSIFECAEGKFCCLFVPGTGDASADCGGFLNNCSDAGGTPSGGNHAAGCQF